MRARTHYEVLGVAKDASDNEIKAAWRAGVKASHPDRHPDDPTAGDRFKEIQAAYETLSDPEKRNNYDIDQRPPLDPDLGWVWEPPPPPPPATPPSETRAPPGFDAQPSWARRWGQGHTASAAPPPPPPPPRPCVGCGAPTPAGRVRCVDCWAFYDAELDASYEYMVGIMRLRRVENAMRRSRRVCYSVEQAHLEERYGGLGYWTRDGVLK